MAAAAWVRLWVIQQLLNPAVIIFQYIGTKHIVSFCSLHISSTTLFHKLHFWSAFESLFRSICKAPACLILQLRLQIKENAWKILKDVFSAYVNNRCWKHEHEWSWLGRLAWNRASFCSFFFKPYAFTYFLSLSRDRSKSVVCLYVVIQAHEPSTVLDAEWALSCWRRHLFWGFWRVFDVPFW